MDWSTYYILLEDDDNGDDDSDDGDGDDDDYGDYKCLEEYLVHSWLSIRS